MSHRHFIRSRTGAQQRGSHRVGPSAALSEYIADLNAPRLWSLALVGLTAGGVLCTASRGSILAMFVAAMVTASALALKGGNRGYAVGLVAMLLAGSGLMAWAGQTEFVRGRFALMFDTDQLENGRLPNWRESLQTVPQFRMAGTGLGTYRFVYERFQNRFLRGIAHFHAENQFVQSLVEGGLIALLLLLLAIGLTGLAIGRLYQAGGMVNTVLAAVGTFGLVSQFVGGMFDFGLYIPANMMLMAALCGIVIGRAALLSVWPPQVLAKVDTRKGKQSSGYVASSQSSGGSSRLSDYRNLIQGSARSRRVTKAPKPVGAPWRIMWFGLPAPTSLVTFVVGFLLLGCLFGSLEVNKAGRIEAALRTAPIEQVQEMDDPDVVTAAMASLQTVLPQRWDDALGQERMADLRMQMYRAEAYTQLQASREDGEQPPIDPEAGQPPRDGDLWNRASVWHWHGAVREKQRAADAEGVERLVHNDLVNETLVPAARHLQLAVQSAPTIARLHLRLAELLPVIDPEADETVLLRRARLLAPGDATLLYWIGLLDLQAGRVDSACDTWKQSLLLSPIHLPDVMAGARGRLTIRQLLNDTLPARSDLLLRVARQFFDGEDKAKLRAEFLKRAEEALDPNDLPTDEFAFVAATIYRLLDRPREALEQYADAVSRNSTNLNWRYEYARLLLDQQEFEEAHRQATFLVRADANKTAYKRLLEDVNKQRLRAGTPR